MRMQSCKRAGASCARAAVLASAVAGAVAARAVRAVAGAAGERRRVPGRARAAAACRGAVQARAHRPASTPQQGCAEFCELAGAGPDYLHDREVPLLCMWLPSSDLYMTCVASLAL